MGSKKIKRMLFAIVFLFVVLVGAIAAANLDLVKQKLGISTDEQTEASAMLEETEGDGRQRGSNLSAFLQDETFLIRRSNLRVLRPITGAVCF